MIRDVRNFSVPEKTLDLDCSTGILMPLFDMDTNMLFAAGKGDTTISFLEITDKDPYLVEGLCVRLVFVSSFAYFLVTFKAFDTLVNKRRVHASFRSELCVSWKEKLTGKAVKICFMPSNITSKSLSVIL